MKHLETWAVVLILVVLHLGAAARGADFYLTAQAPVFTFCADPRATEHEVCWESLDHFDHFERACLPRLPGGQSVYRIVLTPPLCLPFRVVVWSTGPNGTWLSDPTPEFQLSPDLNGDGLVKLGEVSRIAAGFGTRYTGRDVACAAAAFGRPGPLPVLRPTPAPACP